MKTTQVLSLYTYLHLKLAKMLYFSFYLICFFFNKNRRTRGQNRFCPEAGDGGEMMEREMAQIMYTHVIVKMIK
jgi:hypothetical protein